MIADRPLEREFAERAHRRALEVDRLVIEANEQAGLRLEEERLRGFDEQLLAEYGPPEVEEGYFAPGTEGLTVEQLRALPYAEYLWTAHWRLLRIRALTAAGYRCQLCNGTVKLAVHHRTYERLGQEELSDLTVLCDGCHGSFHQHRSLERAPRVPDLPHQPQEDPNV